MSVLDGGIVQAKGYQRGNDAVQTVQNRERTKKRGTQPLNHWNHRPLQQQWSYNCADTMQSTTVVLLNGHLRITVGNVRLWIFWSCLLHRAEFGQSKQTNKKP